MSILNNGKSDIENLLSHAVNNSGQTSGLETVPAMQDGSGRPGFGPVPLSPVPCAVSTEGIQTPSGPMILLSLHAGNGQLSGMFDVEGVESIAKNLMNQVEQMKSGIIKVENDSKIIIPG